MTIITVFLSERLVWWLHVDGLGDKETKVRGV